MKLHNLMLVHFFLYIQIFCCSAAPQSPYQCQNNVPLREENCLHGITEGPCGSACLKGPGEICGGKDSMYGVCGDGLSCSNCNRCSGCSFTTFTCHAEDNCLSIQDYWLTSLDEMLEFFVVAF